MNNELKVFENVEFGKIRFEIIDGKELFCASDIAKALGYSNPSKAINDHCRSITKCYIATNQGNSTEMNFIPEGDVYRLIVRSKLPSAEKFEKWLFEEVLPTLRKTGGYVANEDLFVNTYLPYADDNTKLLFNQTLLTIRTQNEIIAKQKKENYKLIEENNHQHKIIDTLTESYDGTYIRTICVDYLNKFSAKTGRDRGELYGDIYKLLGRSLKTDIYYQHEKYIKEQRELVKSNIQYNKEHKLKGSDRREPFLIKHSKAEISKIEYVCDILGKGSVMLEVMSKVFEVGIIDIVDKYNLIKETEGDVI